ncbi:MULTISPECIES: hypothetical protein, partial [unclassified Photorhabdus]|uniref:hypothetical protein n=2 Tax=Photorhabdus TaxID=29487 RepID=UPI001960859F
MALRKLACATAQARWSAGDDPTVKRVSQKVGIENNPTEIYCLLLGLATHDRLKIAHNIRATALDK